MSTQPPVFGITREDETLTLVTLDRVAADTLLDRLNESLLRYEPLYEVVSLFVAGASYDRVLFHRARFTVHDNGPRIFGFDLTSQLVWPHEHPSPSVGVTLSRERDVATTVLIEGTDLPVILDTLADVKARVEDHNNRAALLREHGFDKAATLQRNDPLPQGQPEPPLDLS